MRGILFDKDGTLIDFHASWSGVYRELGLELAGGDAGRAAAMLVAGGMDPDSGRVQAGSVLAAGNTIDIVKLFFPGLDGAELKRMIERIDAIFLENGIRCSVPVPGLESTLAALAGTGIAMGVATSDGTAAAKAALAALGVASHLPHVYGYDSVARPKPAPDMVHAFAAAIGVPAEAIVVIGDNTHDLEMARSAGAGAAIGVLSGTGTAADLAPLADCLLDSIADLPSWLGSRRGREVGA
jgi:phosphoglycolate phosphatase